MKKNKCVKAMILGVGDRGLAYGDYALNYPEELKIVALCGGDFGIMHDVVNYFKGGNISLSLTPIEDSIAGHFIVYAAEESRKKEKIVNLSEYKNLFLEKKNEQLA